jgi:hypothetical protein
MVAFDFWNVQSAQKTVLWEELVFSGFDRVIRVHNHKVGLIKSKIGLPFQPGTVHNIYYIDPK